MKVNLHRVIERKKILFSYFKALILWKNLDWFGLIIFTAMDFKDFPKSFMQAMGRIESVTTVSKKSDIWDWN